MRMIHLGDLHLGKSVLNHPMLEVQKDMLQKVLNLIDEKQIDAVLIAGDVYDRSVPGEEAVRVLDWFLNAAADKQVKVFLISGNHDSEERLNFGSRFFEKRNVYISGKYEGRVRCVTVRDEYGPLHVWLLPFIKAARVRDYHPELDTSSYGAAVQSVLSLCKINPLERNIILAHQFVTSSGKDPESGGSEYIAPENVGTIEKVDASVFDAFDYVALGHIHRPQKVGREEARYSGSLLKYSLSEADSVKSVPIVTMKEKGSVPDIELAVLPPLRDMRHLTGTFEEIRQVAETDRHRDDYMYITLTDEGWSMDIHTVLSRLYPNVIRVESAKTGQQTEEMDFSAVEQSKDFATLLGEFFRQVTGEEMSEAERKELLEIAKEAGVINEAD